MVSFADFTLPAQGTWTPIVEGYLYWVRMPLPFQLNHINLWVIDEGDGWCLIDSGIQTDEVKALWRQLCAGPMAGKPIKRLIVTHFHPDHVGLAGWFQEEFQVPLWMTLGEWGLARNMKLEPFDETVSYLSQFYHRAGFGDDLKALIAERCVSYPARISKPPAYFTRIQQGDCLNIGGREWQVRIGQGHCPEHACLYNKDDNILISGDQLLPKISPNVAIWPVEPDADPLQLFLQSLHLFDDLDENCLVLPSHDRPFYGARNRAHALAAHHQDRLEETLALCAEPVTAYDVLQGLFTRPLDSHQVFFAIGEAMAHLHHLVVLGKVTRKLGDDGRYYFAT